MTNDEMTRYAVLIAVYALLMGFSLFLKSKTKDDEDK